MKITNEGGYYAIYRGDNYPYLQREDIRSPTETPLSLKEYVLIDMAKEILRLKEIEWMYKELLD